MHRPSVFDLSNHFQHRAVLVSDQGALYWQESASLEGKLMDEGFAEDKTTEEDILTEEVSDEVLEATASKTKITLTFSYVPLYCRFC